MATDLYARIRDDAVEKYGVEEGMRLTKLLADTAHVRNKYVSGAQAFFDYVHEWERACRRLKNSGADLSKIEIVKRG